MKTNKKNLIISQLELTKRIKLSLLLFSLKKLCYCKVIILFAFPFLASAQQSLLPWLKNIDPQDKIRMIHTIKAEAEVTVSDGLVYKANSIFHDKQRAVFQLVYSNRTIAQAVEGKYIWDYDGKVETEASSSVEEFILGHQIHAQILFFDKLHQSIGTPKPGKFLGKDCFTLASDDKNSPFNFYYEESGATHRNGNSKSR